MWCMPSGAEVDAPRAQYEQMREQILARVQASSASYLLMQQGMRSWIEAGGQMPAKPLSSAEPSKTATNWKPIIPIVASLLVRLAERNTNGPHHA